MKGEVCIQIFVVIFIVLLLKAIFVDGVISEDRGDDLW